MIRKLALHIWGLRMLDLGNVNVAYGRRPVIHNMHLKVGEGEAVSVLGPNGAGKTTLLRAISGMIPVKTGSIRLNSQELANASPNAVARHGVMHVAEGRRLFGNMTCRENLMLGGYMRSGPAVNQDFRRLLDVFPEIEPKLDVRAGALSGGQQQMLAIARGLMSRPKILMLDEPTIGLSPLVVQRLKTVLTSSAREFFGSLLLVEQDLSLALAVTSRVYVIRNGRIVHEGAVQNIQRENLVEQYFGVA
ncbi:ABC transporter family protein [Paraburkholderia xenovorans LB400]|nr:ABC transporter ATP-binding protein [Paraburkholderia xenovorans]AIP34925.1 ABC transporter family protein [Paraburkholderia xenovorans LB400]